MLFLFLQVEQGLKFVILKVACLTGGILLRNSTGRWLPVNYCCAIAPGGGSQGNSTRKIHGAVAPGEILLRNFMERLSGKERGFSTRPFIFKLFKRYFMKILHVDRNHPLLLSELQALGCENHEDYEGSKEEIMKKISAYNGMIIRSRFPVDRAFLEAATNLRFIGRVGAGLENIDEEFAAQRGVVLFNAPEGNRNAVGEHALGMLLALMNKMVKAHNEVCRGVWLREENRGFELDNLTVGIYGYGNMGKAFAKKLRGFDCEVICYDIQGGVGDENARQVGILEFRNTARVVSLHTPQTPETMAMVNAEFINAFAHPFWFVNTARGKSVVTADLAEALKSGKVLGAALDVLEYEKSSFEDLFSGEKMPEPLDYLLNAENVVVSPHVAGWTVESKEKLARTIVDKIRATFFK